MKTAMAALPIKAASHIPEWNLTVATAKKRHHLDKNANPAHGAKSDDSNVER